MWIIVRPTSKEGDIHCKYLALGMHEQLTSVEKGQ